MEEMKIWEIKNRVVAEKLIPKREGGRLAYETRSLPTHWFMV